MKRDVVLAALGLGLSIGGISCKGTGPTAPATTKNNLITNQWFERNGKPSLAGWDVLDTAYAKVVPDSLPAGGRYALWLAPAWCIPDPCFMGGSATAKAYGLNGSLAFNLSFYEKNTSLARGQIAVRVLGPDTSYILSIPPLSGDGPQWKWTTVSFSAKVDPTDTIYIGLGSVPLTYTIDSTGTGVYYSDVTLTRAAP